MATNNPDTAQHKLSKFAHTTKTYWHTKTDNAVRSLYSHRRIHGLPIEPELQAELVRRFPHYDAKQQIFTGRGCGHSRNNTIADKTANMSCTKGIISTSTTTLTVTLKPTRKSSDTIKYSNVYVNGRLILRNHANTEIKLFADGTLLGVRGIVTTDKKLPRHPLWMIYDTNMVPNKWAGQDKWCGYNVYAHNISQTPTGINITLSDRRLILLTTEKLKRVAGTARFEIQR